MELADLQNANFRAAFGDMLEESFNNYNDVQGSWFHDLLAAVRGQEGADPLTRVDAEFLNAKGSAAQKEMILEEKYVGVIQINKFDYLPLKNAAQRKLFEEGQI